MKIKWTKVGDRRYHSSIDEVNPITGDEAPKYEIIKNNQASYIGGRKYNYWWVQTYCAGWYIPEDKFDTLKEAKAFVEKLEGQEKRKLMETIQKVKKLEKEATK